MLAFKGLIFIKLIWIICVFYSRISLFVQVYQLTHSLRQFISLNFLQLYKAKFQLFVYKWIRIYWTRINNFVCSIGSFVECLLICLLHAFLFFFIYLYFIYFFVPRERLNRSRGGIELKQMPHEPPYRRRRQCRADCRSPNRRVNFLNEFVQIIKSHWLGKL